VLLPDLLFNASLAGIALDPKTALVAHAQGNRPNIPDLMFPTIRLAIELKAPGRKATPGQLHELAVLRQAGWQTLVTDDMDEAWNTILSLARPQSPST
jgi:hypothetical protein